MGESLLISRISFLIGFPRRNEHTTDRFFWGEKGLFSAQYAEENHFLFPSLKVVVEGIGEEKIFEGLELSADDWEEIEEYEYAFV